MQSKCHWNIFSKPGCRPTFFTVMLILATLVTRLSLCLSPCPGLTVFILISRLVAITALSSHTISVFPFFLHFVALTSSSSYSVCYVNIYRFRAYSATFRVGRCPYTSYLFCHRAHVISAHMISSQEKK